MGDAHHCSGTPISEMTYTVSSGTLNPTIPYHTSLSDVLNLKECIKNTHYNENETSALERHLADEMYW